eukprot:scaffold122092_cov18-Tisochrysis_lutea.AAC.1
MPHAPVLLEMLASVKADAAELGTKEFHTLLGAGMDLDLLQQRGRRGRASCTVKRVQRNRVRCIAKQSQQRGRASCTVKRSEHRI